MRLDRTTKKQRLILIIFAFVIIAMLLVLFNSIINPEKELQFTTLFKGGWPTHTDHPLNAGYYIITNETSWSEIWNNIYAHDLQKAYEPKIDFNNKTLIIAYLGLKNTGGYSITISKVVETTDKVKVYVEKTSPGQVATQAVTAPVHVIELQLPKKPTEFIVNG